MSFTLVFFNEDRGDVTYQHDYYPGRVFQGHPAELSGRPGVGFDIPDGTPAKFGSTVTYAWPDVSVLQRGISILNDGTQPHPWTPGQQAAFEADDIRKPVT